MPPKVKKEKIPPPGNKKDEYTNFYTKAKWKGILTKPLVELEGRNLRPVGSKILGNAISKSTIIMTLDLGHNHIGDAGAIELAQFLKLNQMLMNLNLSNNDLTDVGAIAIASAFIPCANPTGAPSFWNRSIENLNMTGNRIGDDGLVALANAAACHRGLQKIDLTNNVVGGFGCRALMRSMERNPTCVVLLGANRLGDEGVQHLCAAWRRFGGSGSHSALDLHSNDFSRLGGVALGELLENNTFLQDANLSWNSLGHKGVESLVAHLLPPFRCVLRSINISHNMLGDEGAEWVARLIEANHETLVRVNVSFNEISDRGGERLAASLMRNKYLTSLIATNNEFGERTAAAIVAAVEKSNTLKMITLKGCPFNESQKTALSDCIKRCPSSGFRLDYGGTDDGAQMGVFLDRLKEYVQMVQQELAAKAASKKGKKGKKKDK